jgi:hypothetical protein
MLVIWQRVRRILDISCVLFFCTLVPDFCCYCKYLSFYAREARRKSSRCSCKVSFAADLNKNWLCPQIFVTDFSVGFRKIRSADLELLRQKERKTGQRDGAWRDAVLQRPVRGALCFARVATVNTYLRLTFRTRAMCRLVERTASAELAACSTGVYRCLRNVRVSIAIRPLVNVCWRKRRCVPDYCWLLSCTHCRDRLVASH